MKRLSTNFARSQTTRSRCDARGAVLLLVCLGLIGGVALGLFFKSRPSAPKNPTSPPLLSATTRTFLKTLNSPAELRFYSLLAAPNIGPELPAFSARVRDLLQVYQETSGGKVKATVFDLENSTPEAALADGIRPFNLEKGEACFLGLVAQVGDQKQVLPRLSPDYEGALEADITRALIRAAEASQGIQGSAPPVESEETTIESVKSTVPNYASIPLEAGTRVLRETMLRDLQKTSEENAARMAAAQATLGRALESGSDAEKQAARKALTEVEQENVTRLQSIIVKSSAQIRALERLKSTEH